MGEPQRHEERNDEERMGEPQRHKERNGEERNGKEREELPEDLGPLSREVVDAAFRVHKVLGPGLLESVYERCLCRELERRGIEFRSQVSLPIVSDGCVIEAGLRVDILVENRLIVELKAVEALHPLHTAQVLIYLKLTRLRLGLLINFNVPLIRDGIKRLAL